MLLLVKRWRSWNRGRIQVDGGEWKVTTFLGHPAAEVKFYS